MNRETKREKTFGKNDDFCVGPKGGVYKITSLSVFFLKPLKHSSTAMLLFLLRPSFPQSSRASTVGLPDRVSVCVQTPREEEEEEEEVRFCQ